MTRGRLAYIALTVATLGLWLVMSLWSLPLISAEADGLTPFDLRPFGYGTADAQAFLNALSDEGRAFYVDVQHRLDLVYPALLALWLAITLWALLPHWPRWAHLGLGAVAFAGATFDYIENARIGAMLTVGSATPLMISAASQATIAKSALFGALMVLLVWLLARKIWSRIFG